MLPASVTLIGEDFNKDWRVNLEDIVIYFIYTIDSTEVLAADETLFERMDYRRNGVLDSVDTEKFINAVLHTRMVPLVYTPTLVLPEIIVFMNDRVRAAARSQMEWIEAAHPEWRYLTKGIRRQLGLTDLPPVPVSYDLSGNGSIDKNDFGIFFACFADSLDLLPPDSRVLQAMDYNADGAVDVFDVEPFFVPPVTDDLYDSDVALDESIPPGLSEKARYFGSRMVACMQDGAFRERFDRAQPRGSEMYTWVDYKAKNVFVPCFGLTPSPPLPAPADLNHDFTRRADDAAVFFSCFSDSLDLLPDTSGVLREMDLNFDGRVDTLDVECFFHFLFFRQNPAGVSPDSMPPMSLSARRLSLQWLEKMGPLHPEWRSGKSQVMQGYLSEVQPCRDLNSDGRVNIADAVALILLGRRDPSRADWNGDGSFDMRDVIAFLLEARALMLD